MTLFYDVKDHGALGDGIADDTAAIQEAADAARASGGILCFPSGAYVLGVPNALGNVSIQGSGSSSVVQAKANSSIAGLITSGGFVIRDIVFDGNRANNGIPADNPVVFLQSHARLFNVEVRHAAGYAIWLGGGEDYLIDGCWIHDNGGVAAGGFGCGLYTVGTQPPDDVRVFNSRWENNYCTVNAPGPSSAININATGVIIKGNYLLNNLNENGGQLAINDGGIGSSDVYFVISDNVIRQSTRLNDSTAGIEVEASKGVVANNTIVGASSDGIRLESSATGILVQGNVISCSGNGIYLINFAGVGESKCAMRGNHILAANPYGVASQAHVGSRLLAEYNYIDPSIPMPVAGTFASIVGNFHT